MTAPSLYRKFSGGKAVSKFDKQIVPDEARRPDALAGHIENSLRGMAALRDDNEAMRAQISQLERDNIMLESEVQTLKIQLEAERLERRHYHSLANEIITRLDVVGRTVDEVVQRAQQEVYRQRAEQPRAELPELKIPAFLAKGPAIDPIEETVS